MRYLLASLSPSTFLVLPIHFRPFISRDLPLMAVAFMPRQATLISYCN